MISPNGLRGMLLEEAVLVLLETAGYQVIRNIPKDDDTIQNGHSGLELKGRGGLHQIDAIANYLVAHPFSNPQRLLVEAKCYADSRKVGLPIIRNSIGVLKDVGEYWVSRDNTPAKLRYHYQYAIFSASEFSVDAERYAFAHDIYLVPLQRSKYAQPLVKAIQKFDEKMVPNLEHSGLSLTTLRALIRKGLEELKSENRDNQDISLSYFFRITRDDHVFLYDLFPAFSLLIDDYGRRCLGIRDALVGMVGNQFPIFLLPRNSDTIRRVADRPSNDPILTRITWDNDSWYIQDRSGTNLFSFDLPNELFKLYAKNGLLTPQQAALMKSEIMGNIQALTVIDGQTRLINFKLDSDWLDNILERLGIS